MSLGGTDVAAAAAMAMTVGFPSGALQPRTETGAKQFVTKHPEYDGRGTIIAILDSGVDPWVGGMQTTSDGKCKVIERIDCSGSGDVNMVKEVKPKEDGTIEGLTGRKLTIDPDWKNPSGTFRIGAKRIFDIFPKSLKDRTLKERQESMWDPGHKQSAAQALKRIREFDDCKKNSAPVPATSSNSSGSVSSVSSETKPEQGDQPLVGLDKLYKESLDCELEVLNSLDKKHKDPSSPATGGLGPIYDVVSFHDGDHWNVVIDVTEEGDLPKALRLRPYSETYEFLPLTEQSKLNVSVNVFEDGNVVQIVGVCSSHGTHVASIAAAHFPDNPEKNGLAPGAQIISLSIGDGRLNVMETGTSLSRAMTFIMQRCNDKSKPQIDVINMSYGEFSHWSNRGRVGSLMHEVINKYGVIWVVSAGNDGPALCTVGTPPDIATNSVIGVGAYVSPEMMVAQYSTREKLPATPYTWTSRGPTIDGDRGVTVCAPGGAITSVPPFNLRCSQLMNGTSMASPHVCGAVSLLLSGLKKLGKKHSPFSVKRALSATARPLPDLCHYGQGHGLLQIEDAFTHLVKYNDCIERDVRFAVSCNASGSKGIHLRGPDAMKTSEVTVKVDPVFLGHESEMGDLKVSFNLKLVLSCSESWVKHPDFLDLMYVSRHFLVSIDPTALPPGVHSAYVKAYDTTQPEKGMLFEVPITVVKPEPMELNSARPSFVIPRPTVFKPNNIRRHFLMVPDKATWAVIRVRSHDQNNSGFFVLHTVQVLPKTIVKVLETNKNFNLVEQGEYSHPIEVKGGYVLEVCLAKWWANIGDVEVSYSVTFHGLMPDPKEVVFHGASSIMRVDVTSGLHNEEVAPEIKLKSLVQNYRPTEAKVQPLGERDVLPQNRIIYELQLTYNFSLSKAYEITPNLTLLSDVLYESEYESQIWMLYNSHKQYVASGDAYPSRWSVKVEKDDYVLRAQVRHEKKDVLDRLIDMPLSLEMKLQNPITMDVYSSFAEASVGGKKCSSFVLASNKTVPIFLTSLSSSTVDKFAKNAMVGVHLQGTMTLAKDEFGKKVDTYTVKYIFNDFPKKDKGGSGSSGPSSQSSKSKKAGGDQSQQQQNPTADDLMAEYLVGWLTKADPKADESAEVYAKLLEGAEGRQAKSAKLGKGLVGAGPLQVHAARLASFDQELKLQIPEDLSTKHAETIVDICDKILDMIQQEELLAFFAIKTDTRPDAAEIKKDMEKQRGWLLEALAKKGVALCTMDKANEATPLLFDCLKFVDQTDSRVSFFVAYHAEKMGHYGRAAKLLLNQLEAKPNSPELERRLHGLYAKLGWDHCAAFGRLFYPLKFPSAHYDMF